VKPVFQAKYARIYFDSGRYKEAKFLEVAVLEKQTNLLGTDHPDTACHGKSGCHIPQAWKIPRK
jgi:hypothetical protein